MLQARRSESGSRDLRSWPDTRRQQNDSGAKLKVNASDQPGRDPRLLVNIFGEYEVAEKTRMNSREAASVLLMSLAKHKKGDFACSFAYDDDSEFLNDIAETLGMLEVSCSSFISRLRRVIRKLEDAGILGGALHSCHAEYLGEPRVLKRYEFTNPSYAFRLAPERYPHYRGDLSPEVELKMLLERAFS